MSENNIGHIVNLLDTIVKTGVDVNNLAVSKSLIMQLKEHEPLDRRLAIAHNSNYGTDTLVMYSGGNLVPIFAITDKDNIYKTLIIGYRK